MQHDYILDQVKKFSMVIAKLTHLRYSSNADEATEILKNILNQDIEIDGERIFDAHINEALILYLKSLTDEQKRLLAFSLKAFYFKIITDHKIEVTSKRDILIKALYAFFIYLEHSSTFDLTILEEIRMLLDTVSKSEKELLIATHFSDFNDML